IRAVISNSPCALKCAPALRQLAQDYDIQDFEIVYTRRYGNDDDFDSAKEALGEGSISLSRGTIEGLVGPGVNTVRHKQRIQALDRRIGRQEELGHGRKHNPHGRTISKTRRQLSPTERRDMPVPT